MDKSTAIELLGGTHAEVARQVGVSAQAVSQWPEVLPRRIADRVQAALWRKSQIQQPAANVSAFGDLDVAHTPEVHP